MPPDSRSLGSHSVVALIPARSGSKRIPGKNTKLLRGRPLIDYTLDLARACPLFRSIIVSSDDCRTLGHAYRNGASIHLRREEHASDSAHDFLWVQDVMQEREEEIFCILRPTSPFRTQSTIRRAYARLIGSGADSVRAVETVSQHPGKMWKEVPGSTFLQPLLDGHRGDGTPWHSAPTQTLPTFYVQNASLEMAWTRVLQTGTITGHHVAPFLTERLEGFDINTPADFEEAERIAATWSAQTSQ